MEESYTLGIGPRTDEEFQYLLSKGLLVEKDGDYHEMSTILDESTEGSFYDRNYSLPLVGIENISGILEETCEDNFDDKENVQPSLPSDNSYNEQMEKNFASRASPINKHQDGEPCQGQDKILEVDMNSLSISGINNRSFTISVHDPEKSCSSGDMDDTMTTIEKLLALADQEEGLNALTQPDSLLATSGSICQEPIAESIDFIKPPEPFCSNNSIAQSPDLICMIETPEKCCSEKIEYLNTEKEGQLCQMKVDVDPNSIDETPEQFCPSNAGVSSTGSRHIETPKSRENKTGNDSEDLMYFSPLKPKRVLDLKKGKFFSPSPPRPEPNANPPRGIRTITEKAHKEKLLTPGNSAKFCERLLRNASSEKKKTPLANRLYADVSSPVKQYIYGKPVPSLLLNAKIKSLPVPQKKREQGLRAAEAFSNTRIPRPSISASCSKVSIGSQRTSLATNRQVPENQNLKQTVPTGIPKPPTVQKFKVMTHYEGSAKQKVRTVDDQSMSDTLVFSGAVLRHTGLRDESGNASILQGSALKRLYIPGTPPTKPICFSDRNAN